MRSFARTQPRCSSLFLRRYATGPVIPVIPKTVSTKDTNLADATPPTLPPAFEDPVVSAQPVHNQGTPNSSKPIDNTDAVPFATRPVVLEETVQVQRPRHRIRNGLLYILLGGGLVYGGGLYAALNNDTAYDIYTEYVPYGEDIVLAIQEQEFKSRFPGAAAHTGKSETGRSTLANVYVTRSGAEAKVREEKPAVSAKILQPGPQNSAIKTEDKATPGGSSHVAAENKAKVEQAESTSDVKAPAKSQVSEAMPARATSGKVPAGSSTSALSAVEHKVETVATKDDKAAPPTSPVEAQASSPLAPASHKTPADVEIFKPVLSEPLKTFDIGKAYDRSVENLQFAINGVIKAANEYGSSPFFRASLQNAQDEVIALNEKIAVIQREEEHKSHERLEKQSQEYGRIQQAQISEVNKQVAAYQQQLAEELEQERHRLNQAYSERLAEEVRKVESLSEQKLQNKLTEQAIEMQRKLNRSIKAKVEEERGGRLGKLADLQKSVVELKQLSVDSTSFIQERSRLQDLEVALAALKSVLAEGRPRPFIRELAAVKELAGQDELLKASIDSIDTVAYESGVPTLSQLSDRFRVVADEVRKSALLPEAAGVAGHATSWFMSKVMMQKRGMVSGNDVAAVLARTEAHLEASDLDSATREMNQLSGWSKIISSDWLSMARRHLEVQQAVDLIEQSLILQALKSN